MPHLIVLNFIKNLTWKGWLAVAAILCILVLMGTCAVNKVVDQFGDNRQVTENNKDRDLREDLSVKRQDNVTTVINAERKLNETLDQIPDGVPSARRLARACHELRSDGYEPLPVACRPEANGESPG